MSQKGHELDATLAEDKTLITNMKKGPAHRAYVPPFSFPRF